MAKMVRQDGPTRWHKAAARAVGVIGVVLMTAVAAVALLLPPVAEADGRGPAAVPGGLVPEGEVAGARPAASLTALGGGPWMAGALSAAASTGRRQAALPSPCGGSGFTGKVNLNLASERELDLLPGIGPTKAKRIVAWRASHGRFRRLRDLRRVKGFGRKTVLKLTPYLTLDGPTTATARSRR
jgi:competence protein ComEA